MKPSELTSEDRNSMNIQSIHITQLLLDVENPRHDVINDQPQIIKQLLDTEQIYNLAKDIANQGSLSPLDIIGVLPTKSGVDYIVLEGNRRVCACLLLNNPELASSRQVIKNFKSLQNGGNYPQEISCRIFQSRDEADHWIQLRHEGQQNGIGTKRWDSTQIARYSDKKGRTNPNIQATKILDFALTESIIDEDKKPSFSITTLQRYLNNPFVRNIFGLEDKQSIKSKHDLNTFRRIVSRFLEDSEKGIVHSRSKQEDWQDYANLLQKEITDPPPADNPLTNFAPHQGTQTIEPPKKTPTKSKQDSSKRQYIIPYNVKFSISDKTLNRIYIEMSKLQIENHEFSTAYLLRAFIEGSCVLYLQRHMPQELQKDSKLNRKLTLVSEHLQNSGVKPQKLHVLNITASEKNSLISPLILGGMVHLSVIPTKRELIAMWDKMEGVFIMIHDRL